MKDQQTWRRVDSFREEEGSVLVVALLILVFLTLIGLSASTTSELEIQVSGNEQAYRVAFYNADSGVYFTPKIIRPCIETGAMSGVTDPDSGVTDPNSGLTTYNYLDTTPPDAFLRQVMGYDAYDPYPDIGYSLGGDGVGVDVRRIGARSMAGGGTEFSSGADGVGGGTTGGVAVIFEMISVGQGPRNSQSQVRAQYRVVPGVAGGL